MNTELTRLRAEKRKEADAHGQRWGCSRQRVAGRFTAGSRVRCHANCKIDPEEHECVDGTLTQETRGGNGWWNMNRDAGGEILVHEQELSVRYMKLKSLTQRGRAHEPKKTYDKRETARNSK